MQTIEKALHQPMPFTTGGQTISDRLTAAKHSLAGSQLGKTICKATTEEVMAPKKKHLDYLLHCTNEPNVSIPSMANLLMERTQHPNWTVVYKALITIHNIMCYGNERFSQYLASCNNTFNLGTFLDKSGSSGGYEMSTHVRRYGKYIGEKIATYRVCAFDFCKVKRGREDGLLRTMHTDKLLKTIPILQNQIDALLEFQVTSAELNNGVINCSFILLFRDLIRLFACYNDAIINVLEKYFDMNKKQCRDALETYKSFITRLDKVAEFLRIAESVGIDRGEIPDLTRAPASLLEALEAHLIHLEGGKPPVPAQVHVAQQQLNNFSFTQQPSVAEVERQRYIELEQERLRQFEEQKKQVPSANPFASDAAAASVNTTASSNAATSKDLLDLFQTSTASAAPSGAADNTNPFASFGAAPASAPAPAYGAPSAMSFGGAQPQQSYYGNIPATNGHQAFGYGGATSQADDLARMTAQMSLNTSGAWNGASVASSNPFGAPAQPLYTNPMGAYPQAPMQAYQQQPMWNPQMGYGQPFAYQQPGQLSYQQQQQQVQLVNQAAAAQQQAQHQASQASSVDPFAT